MARYQQFQENGMNPYIWCGVGALVGWLASRVMGSGEMSVTIENVCVGVFGAFIGGDFIVAMFNGGVVDDKVFHVSSLGIAVASAVVMLLLLKLMRRVVGPIRSSKSQTKQRY
jgi:uncharacterized membrane protein YeaQ/YmgE (transglycosylase-associated protein family)